MRRIWITWAVLASVVLTCGKKSLIDKVSLEQSGLRFEAAISADRDDPSMVNGKLMVVNTSSDFKKYGNFRLFLTDGEQSVRTTVKASQVEAMVDKRLVELSPGDTLHFFTCWTFPQRVSFGGSTFALRYDDTVAPPEGTGESPPTVSAE